MRPSPASLRSHPLFSRAAVFGGLVLLAGLALGVVVTGGQAFSPGELSAVGVAKAGSGGFPSHAAFGDNCLACHTPFEGIVNDSCLGCHTPIADQQARNLGLHGPLVDLDCTACHVEHEGAEFDQKQAALVHFSADAHAAFFPLEGAHQTVDCVGCHQNDVFVGTPTDCQACHDEPDVHAGQMGLACASCHSTVEWTSAQMAVHPFPLDHGLLGTLECAVCHTVSYTTFSCTACHETGYENRVGEVVER